jgi:hypothetical protein
MEPIRKDKNVIVNFNEGKGRVVNYIKSYMSMIAAIFIVVVVVAIFFTDVSLAPATAIKKLTVTVIVLIVCNNAMYAIGLRSGKDRGFLDDGYIEASDNYEGTVEALKTGGKLPYLDSYCKELIQRELDSTKEGVLIDVNITLADYKAKYRGLSNKELKEMLNPRQCRAVKKANRVKPMRLKPSSLISYNKIRNNRSFLSPDVQTAEGQARAKKIASSILVSIMTASVATEIILNPGWNTVAECLLKLFSIVMSGYTGYTLGFDLIAKVGRSRKEGQTLILSNFMQWKAPQVAEEVITVKVEPQQTAVSQLAID